jgi:hypothetical protein
MRTLSFAEITSEDVAREEQTVDSDIPGKMTARESLRMNISRARDESRTKGIRTLKVRR